MSTAPDTTNTPPPPAPAPAHAAPGGLTQEQIDKQIADATEKAVAEAKAQVEADLGMSVDDVKKMQEEAQAAADAKLSEVEKREKKALEAIAAAEEREKTALLKARDADALAELVNAGMDKSRAGRMVGTLGLAADADEAAITAAVEALKTEDPGLFAASTTAPPAPKSTPPGVNTPGTKPTAPASGVDDLMALYKATNPGPAVKA